MTCVTKTKQRNFYVPGPLNELLDDLCRPLGEKKKWTIMSAALLAYYSMAEAKREKLRRRVAASQADEAMFMELIDESEKLSQSEGFQIVEPAEPAPSARHVTEGTQHTPAARTQKRRAKP